MTTDPTPLQERIARALRSTREFQAGASFGIPAGAYVQASEGLAAAVLPLIAAEVQAAKVEALREAAEDLFYDGDQDVPIEGNALLHSRADEYETGDSDEHR